MEITQELIEQTIAFREKEYNDIVIALHEKRGELTALHQILTVIKQGDDDGDPQEVLEQEAIGDAGNASTDDSIADDEHEAG